MRAEDGGSAAAAYLAVQRLPAGPRRAERPHRSACGCGPASLKPGQTIQEPSMSGIAAIVIFLVVIAALNRYEFGRFD